MLLRLSVLALACALAAAQYYGDVYCKDGRDAIVHLFEWKWSDIQKACPGLRDMGYCAVQVSPPQEHRLSGEQGYPWWQRYQPVSYIVTSRSGDENAFQSMVSACNDAGVWIYVDAVINHMTGGGEGTGSAGSYWNAGGDRGQQYPGVPFGENDFNGREVCNTRNMEIESYQDVNQVRNCRLVGLRDIKIGADYPRQKVAEYLNKLIDWGVAGFRVDAVKHMWPGDVQNVFNRLHTLPTRWFPGGTKPFIFVEVIDQGGEPIKVGEYTGISRVTEFRYGLKLGEVVTKGNGQRLSFLKNFGEGWGFMSGMSAVTFVDNHDNQRGHGGGGSIVTHKQPREYKIANAFMLAWNFGYVRIMSSFAFSNSEAGPPSFGGGSTKDVECFNGEWVCEHGWRQIANMVKFHNAVGGTSVTNWWDNGGNAIAFSRGSKGFIAINNEGYGVSERFQTGLPAGDYCDVISCEGNRPPCGGSECRGTFNVNGDGSINLTVPNDENPIIALHV